MKKLIAISAMTLVLSTCGVSSNAEEIERETIEQAIQEQVQFDFIEMIIQAHKEQTLLEKQAEEFEAARARAAKMEKRISQLNQHVDNTWYVFSGSTPDGWDCSGLVFWFYSEFGLELEHSATAQKFAGELTGEPLPGDIVAFSHHGTDMAYHNGVYIGGDLFIHSPRVGRQTKISSVTDYAKQHSEISYTRINF